MLNRIPMGINAMARNVIINHPNAFNCEVYRKEVMRTDPEAGGAPTLGGMMVLSSDDESEVKWAFVGMGYSLPADMFQGASMMDRRDAALGEEQHRFLIEPEEMIGNPGGFEIKKKDVIYLLLGEGESAAKVAYEIVDVEATVNVPPYVSRYITNRRADLDLMPGEEAIEP